MATFLYVFPHPDDESFGPAPGIVRQRRAGHEVHLLTFTHGESTSHRHRLGYGRAEMSCMRYRQMQQVAETLDLTSLTVLEYPDGGLAEQNPLRLEEEVADRFHSIRPDVAITFPDHGITRHSDHLTIHHAVKRVACGLRAEGNNHPRRLAFVTFPPPSGDLAPPDDLQHSPPERIDCVVPVCTSELEQGRKALEHYVTYQPDDHRPLKFFADGIPFEIFGESHDPPLLSLLESLPRDTAGFLRPESCRQ
jgi:LmbE family N-acetylglucosaminyl deacetylase